MLHFYGVTINNLYVIKLFAFCYEICNLLKQFRLIFCYSLFPYKCILICTGFYFSTINKNGFSRNFTQIKKSIGHFSKNTFCAWCKMNASKSRKSCMIWGWCTFKKKHEIDISFTIQLHGTGWIITIHVRVKYNLQKCSWRYWFYSFIGRIQVS